MSKTGSKSWAFIYDHGGRQRTAGLGSVGAVTLKQAREIAAQGREMLARKPPVDPLGVWQTAKRAQSVPTFDEAAKVFLAKKGGEWRSGKVKRQAGMVLAKYTKPIAKRRVDEIDTRDVLKVLQPLWAKAPAVGSRLRGYIENVLNGAKALGDIDEGKANPARWRGHLDTLLPKPPTSEHLAAMDYARVPSFVAELRRRCFNEDGSICVSAYALEYCILTAARASEALGSRWREIDLDAKVQIFEAERTKSGRAFEVPLSDAACDIIEAMRAVRVEGCDFVFAGRFKYRPTSSKTFERVLKGMGEAVTTHGFRSSFRDWAGNETATPRDICEMALGHKVGDATERAYRRSDALEKRRALMEAWAAYCPRRRPA